MIRVPKQGDILLLTAALGFSHVYMIISDNYEMKTTWKVLLDQLTTLDYETRKYIFLERFHKNLVEELLMKVRTVFQQV